MSEIKWQEFNHDQWLNGIYWVAGVSPEDADVDWRLVGWPTHPVCLPIGGPVRRVAMVYARFDPDDPEAELEVSPVDRWHLGYWPDDATLTHFAKVVAPVHPGGASEDARDTETDVNWPDGVER
ncbi:hypothetical protein [Marichromatium sp. AB31]|uniref:hypothetical protein n=1 Tax=Marichromatium sp. AB31 TaxID=2483362 RepID=UPI000F3CD1CD|nr:hypothetical protein [Marichromatium sp. AB31]RNE89844.1 hypothetical protein EBL84_09145 [Marichromatium sp. AB31]